MSQALDSPCGKNFFQRCSSATSEIMEPVVQTASHDPRGIFAISGGIAILSGVHLIKASNVPNAVSSWFWRNEEGNPQPVRWSTAVLGASSICVGACAIAVAILGFCDLKPGEESSSLTLEEKNQLAVGSDFKQKPKERLDDCPIVYDFELERCEPTEWLNNRFKESSYLSHPGYHSRHISPIAESRIYEMEMICKASNHPTHGRIFEELSEKLYFNEQTSEFPVKMIKPERCDEAKPIADLFYSRFLDKYRFYGLNEMNAVMYEQEPNCNPRKSHAQTDYPVIYKRSFERIHYVRVCRGQLSPPHESNYCMPDSLISIHELMHAEELGIGKLRQDCKSELIEVMTVTKSIILADEIAKRLDGMDIGVERDYEQKNYSINGCSIPLGRYANFYRDLEKQAGSLGKALVSQESIEFLSCANPYYPQ